VNRGWIDPSHMAVARKAFAAVCRHIKPDGAVTDVCEGTGIFGDYNFYVNRRRPEDELHGRGPVMLAGAEILFNAEAQRTQSSLRK
jgi:unsaturated rhamnogalacturonyl hydrolase